MDRRQFLIRAGVLTGQFVVARFFDRALAFVENHNEPLLEVPRDVSRELFVVEEHFDYKLYLGKPDTFIPDPPTWRELFLLFGDSVKIEILDTNGKSIFGSIEQTITHTG